MPKPKPETKVQKKSRHARATKKLADYDPKNPVDSRSTPPAQSHAVKATAKSRPPAPAKSRAVTPKKKSRRGVTAIAKSQTKCTAKEVGHSLCECDFCKANRHTPG